MKPDKNNSWFMQSVPQNSGYVRIRHNHNGIYTFVKHTIKNQYSCELCETIIPEHVILQANILDRKIDCYDTHTKNIHFSNIEYHSVGRYSNNSLYVFIKYENMYKDKIINILQYYNKPVKSIKII